MFSNLIYIFSLELFLPCLKRIHERLGHNIILNGSSMFFHCWDVAVWSPAVVINWSKWNSVKKDKISVFPLVRPPATPPKPAIDLIRVSGAAFRWAVIVQAFYSPSPPCLQTTILRSLCYMNAWWRLGSVRMEAGLGSVRMEAEFGSDGGWVLLGWRLGSVGVEAGFCWGGGWV